MKQQLDKLNDQLGLVEKFETLFNSPDLKTFNQNYGPKEIPNTFLHNMNAQKSIDAFDGFAFAETDPRIANINAAIAILKQIIPPGTEGLAELDNVSSSVRVFHFFNLAIAAITRAPKSADPSDLGDFIATLFITVAETITAKPSLSQARSSRDMLVVYIRNLIQQQKSIIQANIHEVLPQAIHEENERIKNERQTQAQATTAAFRKKTLRYTGSAALFTTGAGLVTFSGLMQFNPHVVMQIASHLPPMALAMLANLHLMPVLLATLAVTGVGVAGAAAYLAYRTYYPAPEVLAQPAAPVVANPLYPKLVTAALMTSGLGLAGFSALVQFSPILTQFSPKFALLAGLHLSPVALIAIAAVGALLMSVALYRVCKSYMQARADAATATPVVETPAADAAAVQTTEPCYTRAYKYVAASCCFKFGGAARSAATSELNTENQATAGASAAI